MDALREQYEGGFKMSAYKDKTQGTWYVSFRYIDWTGKKTQKLKRGFKTKKEALNYEKLKLQDQMEWVRRMNNIQATAEEIAYKNIIFM